MDTPTKYKLRFFFDYAGGCLWADNDLTYYDFGLGPIDNAIKEKTNLISSALIVEKFEIDDLHKNYLNKECALDPSLWTKKECDDFNFRIEKLITTLKNDLKENFEIKDKQIRYCQDPDLENYLSDPKHFKRT